MAAEAKFEVGDVIRMKKPHPCGSSEWEILRVGADFRLKCQGCGHQVMVPRRLVEKNTKEIRLIDKYGGLKVSLIGFKEHLQVPLSIDITVGDPITPRELEFKYKCMFDDSYINIMAFNKETIIAEKFETFITDNIMNTRAKDFYDLYILLTRFYDELNKDTLVKAIKNTFKRRETNYDVEKIVKTFNLIKESDKLKQNFKNYKNKKSYVANIDYDDVMNSINLIIELLEQELVGV